MTGKNTTTEKESQKSLNYQFTDKDREKSFKSPNHGKRGIGKATKFKNLIDSGIFSRESITDLTNRALTKNENGEFEFGETVAGQLINQAVQMGFRQALLDYKTELEVEKHRLIKEIDNDAESQLLGKSIGAFTRGLNSDEAKEIISKLRAEIRDRKE